MKEASTYQPDKQCPSEASDCLWWVPAGWSAGPVGGSCRRRWFPLQPWWPSPRRGSWPWGRRCWSGTRSKRRRGWRETASSRQSENDIRTYWCIRTATLGHKKTLPCKDLGLKPLIYLRHKQFPNEAHDRVLSRLFVEKIKNDQEGWDNGLLPKRDIETMWVEW